MLARSPRKSNPARCVPDSEVLHVKYISRVAGVHIRVPVRDGRNQFFRRDRRGESE